MIEPYLETIFEGLKSCKVNFSEYKLTTWLFSHAIESSIKNGENPLNANLQKRMEKRACNIYEQIEKRYWEKDCKREMRFPTYEGPINLIELINVAA